MQRVRSSQVLQLLVLLLVLLPGPFASVCASAAPVTPNPVPTLQDTAGQREDSILSAGTPAVMGTPNAEPSEVDAETPAEAANNTDNAWTAANYYRLTILVVGVAIVLFGIIALKLNAFLALIVAALVVSLMGSTSVDLGTKVARVAGEFGNSAGAVGLVIALAAVIGQSLMASGAAERIVAFFMSVLGEKRTPLALCGSGYVLGIPVFFDTVFYLLVPLARSMYLRTRSRYLAGLLAIAAGGAITHTLVPPTPGPMLVASNLGVNLGMMMLIGGVVAIASAAAGLLFAGLADRWIKIPIRWLEDPNFDAEAQHVHQNRELPSLGVSLIPLMLPVLLIAGSTVIGTWADSEQRARFKSENPEAFQPLVVALSQGALDFAADEQSATDDQTRLTAQRVFQALQQRPELEQADVATAVRQMANETATAEQILQVSDALNRILNDRSFYSADLFLGTRLSDTAEKMQGQDRMKMPLAQLQRFNRLLLEDALPGWVLPHQWDSPLRQTANLVQVVGNPSLALLLAAIAALLIEKRQRQVGWAVLGGEIEKALASAGVIILITAAGGAFGAMLKQTGVGDAIKEVFSQYSQSGLGLLVLAFLVSSVLKFAQGSSTVAMITASGMLAPMAVPETLQCHPVYMATAIGGGSLFGSWMNDSGFWIFTKMGQLTSVEGLKTWTPCLAILGATAGLTTLLLAWLMPLV